MQAADEPIPVGIPFSQFASWARNPRLFLMSILFLFVLKEAMENVHAQPDSDGLGR